MPSFREHGCQHSLPIAFSHALPSVSASLASHTRAVSEKVYAEITPRPITSAEAGHSANLLQDDAEAEEPGGAQRQERQRAADQFASDLLQRTTRHTLRDQLRLPPVLAWVERQYSALAAAAGGVARTVGAAPSSSAASSTRASISLA